MKVDLSKYETVKERKKRFKADFPDGRIVVENRSNDIMEYALIHATLYKDAEEQKNGLALSSGYALEIRDKEKSISRKGEEYESVNYSSWVENCEESAIGRALDNAGYAGNDKCSREEMEKAQRMSHTMSYVNEPKKPVKTALSRDDLEKQFLQATSKEVCRDNYKAVRVMNLKEDDKRHLCMVIEARAKELEEVQ